MAFENVRPITLPIIEVADVAALKAIASGGLTQGDQRYVQDETVFVQWQADTTLAEDQAGGIIIPNDTPASGRWLYFLPDSVATDGGGVAPGVADGVQTGYYGNSSFYTQPSSNDPAQMMAVAPRANITISQLTIDVITVPSGTSQMGLAVYNASGTQLGRTASFFPVAGLNTQPLVQSPGGAITEVSLTANMRYYFGMGFDNHPSNLNIIISGFLGINRNSVTPHKAFRENNAAMGGVMSNSVNPNNGVQNEGPWIFGN